MSIEKEILDSIAILIKKSAESNTQIYIGTVTNLNGNKCSMLLNGKVLESVRVYGTTPPVGAILPVFVPSGNFNVAFTMYMQGSGGSSTGGTVTSVAGKTGDVTLNKADVGLSNVANVLQYSEQNKPPYPVTSVNGQIGDVELTIPTAYSLPVASATTLGGVKPSTKTDAMTQDVGIDVSGKLYTEPTEAPVQSVNGKIGAISLTASDVGALPSSTTISTKTSQLENDSSFITAGGAPVQSVNGQTGAVVLKASDVGALPSTTTIPSKTSQLINDSGFLTSAPVTSVNTKTGAVTLTQDNVGDGPTYVRTHNDFTDAFKAQISTNATNISSKQAKITASGILKGDGNGGVSAAIAGTDYAAANLLVVSADQPTSQPTGGVWYKLGKVLS